MKFAFHKNELFRFFVISIATYLIFFGKFLLPNYFFWGLDATNYYLPVREYLYEKVTKEFTFPFWTERVYLGFPIYADIEAGYLNPVNVLSILIFGPEVSYKFLHLSCYLTGSLSLFYLLKRMKINLVAFAAANIIYFFNLFTINHQIHFNIILAIYLFPASIILIEKFLEKKNFNPIIYQSFLLSFIFLLGHTQTFFIYCIGIIIYYLLSLQNIEIKRAVKNTIFYLFFIAILFFIQTAPQIVPTFYLFKESVRDANFNFTEGSFYPKMFVLVFFPDLLSQNSKYLGSTINPYFYEIEIYLYIGISSFLLFLLGFFVTKLDKYSYFAIFTFFLFVILASSRFNPLFNSDTPLISIFRNWHRFVFVFYFGASLVIAKFINNLDNLNLKSVLPKISLIILPIIYLLVLQINLVDSNENTYLNSFFTIENIINHSKFEFTLIIPLLILSLYSLFKLNKISLKVTQALLILIIIIDFSSNNLKYIRGLLKDTSEYNYSYISGVQEKERIIIYSDNNITGYEFLNFKSWSPFGFSNFIALDFAKFFEARNLNTYYFSYIKENTVPEIDYNPADFGIKKVYEIKDKNLEVIYLNTKPVELIKNNVQAEYLVKNEGNMKIKVNVPLETTLQTYIRYSPYWEIKINGKKAIYEKDEIFLKFKVPAGESIVEIKYIPRPFYTGLQFSGFLILFLGIILFINKKQKIIEKL